MAASWHAASDVDGDSFSIINNAAVSLEFNDLAIQEDMMSQHGQLEARIRSLIGEREKMTAGVVATEGEIFGLEASLLDTKHEHELLHAAGPDLFCRECSQIEDSRCRKKLMLHQIYGELLFEKPKHLLCTFGLFKRFEDMIFLGFLDVSSNPFYNEETLRCGRCHQEVDCTLAKKVLVDGLMDELATNKYSMVKKVDTFECSAETCCNKCFSFTELYLSSALANLESGVAQPSAVATYKRGGAGRVRRNLSLGATTSAHAPANVLPVASNMDATDENKKYKDKVTVVTKQDEKKNITNDEVSKLKEEMNNLKLMVSELDTKIQEQNVELRQQKLMLVAQDSVPSVPVDKMSLPSDASVAVNLQASLHYALGSQISVSIFTAAPEEDPHVVLQKWEHELRQCGVPRADWAWLASRGGLHGTAKGWWATHGYSDQISWEEFRRTFLAAFGRAELRRWLTYASHQCLATNEEALGTFVTRSFQLVLRATGQGRRASLALLERHLNTRLGKHLALPTYEDLYFVLVAERVLDFNSTKLLFSKVLAEVRDDERYWPKPTATYNIS